MRELADAMHAAQPPLKLSYDASSSPYSLDATQVCHDPTLAPLDRWISMQTYTGSLPGFVNALEIGLNCTGTKVRVIPHPPTQAAPRVSLSLMSYQHYTCDIIPAACFPLSHVVANECLATHSSVLGSLPLRSRVR